MNQTNVDIIVFCLNSASKLCEISAKVILDIAPRLKKGEKITPQELVKSDDFFDLRVKANRVVIDHAKIMPTTLEMNAALFRHARHCLECASFGA